MMIVVVIAVGPMVIMVMAVVVAEVAVIGMAVDIIVVMFVITVMDVVVVVVVAVVVVVCGSDIDGCCCGIGVFDSSGCCCCYGVTDSNGCRCYCCCCCCCCCCCDRSDFMRYERQRQHESADASISQRTTSSSIFLTLDFSAILRRVLKRLVNLSIRPIKKLSRFYPFLKSSKQVCVFCFVFFVCFLTYLQ